MKNKITKTMIKAAFGYKKKIVDYSKKNNCRWRCSHELKRHYLDKNGDTICGNNKSQHIDHENIKPCAHCIRKKYGYTPKQIQKYMDETMTKREQVNLLNEF